ncbi:hypothetical protein WJ69_34350 [Burkholderia ubonensis]|uniref:chorismate mutase n=1 Tax=Burkholderia ubonensis TaxID=101571 RepID=UPI00075E4398|nr:chorismate mutase [Burkholderia ubonensis]KVN98536.1 hypothetical protein WJ69_34350 [Burkholderia ubonensis]
MSKNKTSKNIYGATIVIGLLGATAACSAGGQSNEYNLELLVSSIAARLQTADAVALTKWDTHKPVYDPQREAAVIADVQAAAAKYQLSPSDAAAIFSDQIEANKVVQFTLLNQWRRAGNAPSTPRRDLTEIRQQLDRLQTDILQNLATVQPLRTSPDCPAQVARSVGRVATTDQLDAQHLAALDRAAASICR